MAPRRGGSSGGGSSSSGSSSSISACPGAFSGFRGMGTTIVIFVGIVLFCFFTLLVHIGLCCVRKRHRGLGTKKLLGPLYITALSFMLFSWILTIITVVLAECGVSAYLAPTYLSIVYSLFFRLGTFLLLCVVVWGINSMLRERLSRQGQLGIHKIIPIVVLAIMGVLTAVYIGISSYVIWASAQFDEYDGYRSKAQKFRFVLPKLYQAYVALYIVSLAVGYGLALHSIFALRSRVRTPVSDLILWTSIITGALILSSIFDISSYSNRLVISFTASDALYYMENLLQILAFAAILFLAKCRSWELATTGGTDVNATPDMGQYQYGTAQQQQQQQQGYYPQTYQTTQHSGYNQGPNEMPAAAPVQGYVR